MNTPASLLVCALLVGASCVPGPPGPSGKGEDTRPAGPTHESSPPAKPPAAGPEAWAFAVIGDLGTGHPAERAVTRRMCSFQHRHPFDVVFTTGDNVYPDGDPGAFDAAFKEPLSCLTDAGVAVHASLGNHDVRTDDGLPEIDDPAFGMEGRNYVLRIRGVRFVVWDSTSENFRWLRRHLGRGEGDAGQRGGAEMGAAQGAAQDGKHGGGAFTVVLFHHPVYSPGTVHGSTPGFAPRLPRMFERHGVDLVLNGHDHLYAVSKPLHGIRYVVTGGGGADLYGCGGDAFSEQCTSAHHFLYVAVRPGALRGWAIPPQGPPLGSFTVRG